MDSTNEQFPAAPLIKEKPDLRTSYLSRPLITSKHSINIAADRGTGCDCYGPTSESGQRQISLVNASYVRYAPISRRRTA